MVNCALYEQPRRRLCLLRERVAVSCGVGGDWFMNCPLCKANVPAGSKFCEECGSPLPRACAACGHANSLRAKFCSQCGASLSTASEPVEAAAQPKHAFVTAAIAAERRQL